jgi:hypothetical protein
VLDPTGAGPHRQSYKQGAIPSFHCGGPGWRQP